MKPWVIYARVSSEEQVKGVSLEVQRDSCASYLRSQGIAEHIVIVDEGLSAWSAKHMQRPGMRRILGLVERREIGGVCCWALDRFIRVQRDLVATVDHMGAHGVGFACVTMHIDTTGPMGRFVLQLFAGLAELESGRTSDRVRAAVRHIKAKGGFHGGPVPVGFSAVGEKGSKRLLLDPKTSPVMAKLWPMVIEGATLRECVRYLNESGVRAYRGKPWATNSVSSYLRCERVVGHIVTRETFDRARVVMDARPSPRQRGRAPGVLVPSHRASRVYVLAGLAFCAHCRSALVGSYGTGRKGPVFYYRCSNANRRGRQGCPAGMIPAALAEQAVIGAVRQSVEQDGGRQILEAWHARAEAVQASVVPLEGERHAAAMARDAAQARIDRLIDSLTADAGPARRAVEKALDAAQLELERTTVTFHGIEARLASAAVTAGNAAVVYEVMREAVAELTDATLERQADGLRSLLRACWLAIDVPRVELELVVDPAPGGSHEMPIVAAHSRRHANQLTIRTEVRARFVRDSRNAPWQLKLPASPRAPSQPDAPASC